jgi:hypothetical protein
LASGRLRIGAVEHREIGERPMAFGRCFRPPAIEGEEAVPADHLLDRLDDELGFGAFRRRGMDGDALGMSRTISAIGSSA